MKLTGLAKTTAKSDTSSAVLNVHILQVKKVAITNVNKPPGYIVSQPWNKHNIHRVTNRLKANVTLLQFPLHLFQYVCVWVAVVYIPISCEIRECSVRNLSRLMNEWCCPSCEQYPLTSGFCQWPYLIYIITVWKSKHDFESLTHSLCFSLVWHRTKGFKTSKRKHTGTVPTL